MRTVKLASEMNRIELQTSNVRDTQKHVAQRPSPVVLASLLNLLPFEKEI
jgi:hypothetical protein